MSFAAEQAALQALMDDEKADTTPATTNNNADNDTDSDSDDEDRVNIVLNNADPSQRQPRQPRAYPRKTAAELSGDTTTTTGAAGSKAVSITHPFLTHPNDKVYDLDIDTIEDKKWRQPGADITDYFNYGLNEQTFRAYAQLQLNLRNGVDPNKVKAEQVEIAKQATQAPVLMPPVMPLPMPMMPFVPNPAAAAVQARPPPPPPASAQPHYDDRGPRDDIYDRDRTSPSRRPGNSNDRAERAPPQPAHDRPRRGDSRDNRYDDRYDNRAEMVDVRERDYRGDDRRARGGGRYASRERPPVERPSRSIDRMPTVDERRPVDERRAPPVPPSRRHEDSRQQDVRERRPRSSRSRSPPAQRGRRR